MLSKIAKALKKIVTGEKGTQDSKGNSESNSNGISTVKDLIGSNSNNRTTSDNISNNNIGNNNIGNNNIGNNTSSRNSSNSNNSNSSISCIQKTVERDRNNTCNSFTVTCSTIEGSYNNTINSHNDSNADLDLIDINSVEEKQGDFQKLKQKQDQTNISVEEKPTSILTQGEKEDEAVILEETEFNSKENMMGEKVPVNICNRLEDVTKEDEQIIVQGSAQLSVESGNEKKNEDIKEKDGEMKEQVEEDKEEEKEKEEKADDENEMGHYKDMAELFEYSDSDYGEADMDTDENYAVVTTTANLNETKNINNNMSTNVITGDSINENEAKKQIDPKNYNKFKNDGSFLALAMTMLKNNKKREYPEKSNVNVRRKKKKKTSVHENEQGNSDKEESEGVIAKEEKEQEQKEKQEEDQLVMRMKKEYIDQMEDMEEKGLVTNRGIGSGLVK